MPIGELNVGLAPSLLPGVPVPANVVTILLAKFIRRIPGYNCQFKISFTDSVLTMIRSVGDKKTASTI